MNEELAERLLKAADALHWLGKYDESNALILLARLLRAEAIGSLDEFAEFVESREKAKP